MEKFSLEDDDYGGLFLTQSTQDDRIRYGINDEKKKNCDGSNSLNTENKVYQPQCEDISDEDLSDFQPSPVFNTRP